MAGKAWLAGLNAAQRQAVDHDSSPLLIVAGAGTGKTRTLVSRLARLLDSGVPPERLLLVTFSRRAAEEMIRRAGQLTDVGVARRVHAGTFHAVAYRILRQHGAAVGLGDGFSLLDPGDTSELLGLARTTVMEARRATPAARRRFPRTATLASLYSRVVNTQCRLDDVTKRWYPWCGEEVEGIAAVFDTFVTRKRAQRLLDFDDLLLFWRAAAAHPELGPVLADAYDHILVDEYQDTNVVQAAILKSLRQRNQNITVVGDDAQAIYSFRAATVRNILEFPDMFPGATTVTLEQNYRSTQPILDLANAVLAGAGEGFAKSLWTEHTGGVKPVLATCPDEQSQADAVCDLVLEHRERGYSLRSQAVLFRSAYHSDLLEVELRRRRIPFVKYGGLRFLETGHVRDLLAALRLAVNPYDELAWLRVLQLFDGIGPATADRLVDRLGIRQPSSGGDTATDGDPGNGQVGDPTRGGDPLAHLDQVLPRLDPQAQPIVDALRACRSADEPRDDGGAGVAVEVLVRALDPLIRRRYEQAEVRVRDLEQLAHLATGYPSVSRLLADLTLDPPTATEDLAGPPTLDDDYLILSTVHSAKGGEWPVVHLINATDGLFPSDLATGESGGIDEERRLFYVALTRAADRLHIYAPLRYHEGRRTDRHHYVQRTRFLPPALDGLLDHRPVRSPLLDQLAAGPGPGITTAVDQELRALW